MELKRCPPPNGVVVNDVCFYEGNIKTYILYLPITYASSYMGTRRSGLHGNS